MSRPRSGTWVCWTEHLMNLASLSIYGTEEAPSRVQQSYGLAAVAARDYLAAGARGEVDDAGRDVVRPESAMRGANERDEQAAFGTAPDSLFVHVH